MTKRERGHYPRWRNMLRRCENPDDPAYCDYGARGISVCPEWREFVAFDAWARRTYEPGKTLNRQDNDGPYAPDNCVWSTHPEQMANRRSVRRRSDGRPWFEIARENGVSHMTMWRRVNRLGWSYEDAATTPPKALPDLAVKVLGQFDRYVAGEVSEADFRTFLSSLKGDYR